MSKIKKIILIVLVTIGLSSCDVLMQMSQMANFAKCTFDFNSVSSVQMLGLNIRKGMSRDDRSISVPANASNTVTIPVTADLFQLFSGESADAIVNLAFKLAGAQSNPVNVGVKIKPYITVGGQQLAYPDYITLNKTLN